MMPDTSPTPLLDSRLAFPAPGQVVVRTGKVELGQGIWAALTHIAATTLQVKPERIVIPPVSTRDAPNEGHTAGSLSVQTSGAAIRHACRQARTLLTARAATQLGVAVDQLEVSDGQFLLAGQATGLSYWDMADVLTGVRIDTPRADERPDPELDGDIDRADLSAKISGGGGFIHDISLPGMRHARIVRPPEPGARFAELDEIAFRAEHPDAEIVLDGDFLGVICEREDEAVRAARTLTGWTRWTRPAPADTPGEVCDWLPKLPATTNSTRLTEPGANAISSYSAVYSRPAIAHASIGPSCALAREQDGRLEIWSHSQNVFALRDAIASVLGRDPASLVVTHAPGAGCYGHNGADDAALDAAILAVRSSSAPVRVQWSREEELAWSPVGAPMVVRIDAGLSAEGRIANWKLELWTAPHNRRPWQGGRPNLLSATMTATPHPLGEPSEIPLQFGGGGDRNAVAIYDLPDHQLVHHFVPEPPLRTSSLRALGGHANIFAIESMMDELAAAAGTDPLEFRLRHLSDPRARRVLETAAEMSGWGTAPKEGCGLGLAMARYKNSSGYAAIVAEVAADEDVRVTRVWCATDVGRVVTRDGVINQIEGGIIQSLSWALREAAPLGPRGVRMESWKDYPILRFSETPEIVVKLVGDPGDPSVGAGEVVQGPATAAVANALAAALGVRVRRLPLTRDRIITALSAE